MIKLLYGQHPLRENQLTNSIDAFEEIDFCSGKYDFWGSDSKEEYIKNKKYIPKRHSWHDWTTKQITYTVNSQHYRAPEWSDVNWDNSILVLGCSQVFGTGLDDSQTITHNMKHSLESIDVINLGVPGASPFFQWINTTILVNKNIKPKAVVYVWTYCNRITVLTSSLKTLNSGPWNMMNEPLSRGWNTHTGHSVEYVRHAIDSTTQQWNSASCPVLHFTICEESAKNIGSLEYLIPLGDTARDRQHVGPETAIHWANIICNKLNLHNIG